MPKIMPESMPKSMQNLVFFIEPPKSAYEASLKAANMYLNRFCIDEDAAFELSGVRDFENWYGSIPMWLKGKRLSLS